MQTANAHSGKLKRDQHRTVHHLKVFVESWVTASCEQHARSYSHSIIPMQSHYYDDYVRL